MFESVGITTVMLLLCIIYMLYNDKYDTLFQTMWEKVHKFSIVPIKLCDCFSQQSNTVSTWEIDVNLVISHIFFSLILFWVFHLAYLILTIFSLFQRYYNEHTESLKSFLLLSFMVSRKYEWFFNNLCKSYKGYSNF